MIAPTKAPRVSLPPGLRVVLAPNPSPLTGPGTNTFLLGQREVVVIDPGPDIASHRTAILQAAAPGRITHILVTHAHADHSGGAAALALRTGAPVLAFGDALAGRSEAMRRLADSGGAGGGEGLDLAFRPDMCLRDGERIEAEDWQLTALHMPGHSAGHLCFQWGDTIFCGDLVMAWSSTLISPPDGDLLDYFRSLDRLAARGPARLLPAHGDAIASPAARIAELTAHRRHRTAQILAALQREGAGDAKTLAARIYDVPPGLLPAAARNVFAHLIALAELGAVAADPDLSWTARYALASGNA